MRNLLPLFFLFISIGLHAQTVYMQESFEDGLPQTWIVEGDWGVGTAEILSSAYFTIPNPGTGNIVVFNDDALGATHSGSGSLLTDPIDLTDIEGVILLQFASYFPNQDFYGLNERALIDISVDGVNFEPLPEVAGGETETFGSYETDISAYAGEIITLRFTYDDGTGWNFGWAIDEITIASEMEAIPVRDFAISAGTSSILGEVQAGIDYIPEGFMINNGSDTITSFDILINDGAASWVQSFTNVEIPLGGIYKYQLDPVMAEGDKTYTLLIQNVNGESASDANIADNISTFQLNAIESMNPNKAVLFEMSTSTNCPSCPAGIVFMEEMAKRFPDNFVPVAVHTNDPMVDIDYDLAVASLFTSNEIPFPGIGLDRVSFTEFDELSELVMTRMSQAPQAAISVGAFVSDTELTTSIRVDFLEDVEDSYTVGIIITEDGVTGTDADQFFQMNEYSGGALGPIGGYELLPEVVPASFNVFNSVGRELIGGFDGNNEALNAEVYTVGTNDGWVFDAVEIPSEVDMDNINIIGVLINGEGEIVNATSANIFDAAANGLYENVSTREIFDARLAEVFPNPVSETANIIMDLDITSDINVSVFNALGQMVSIKNHGQQSGQTQLQQDMTNLVDGMYLIKITAGDKFITKKINKLNR